MNRLPLSVSEQRLKEVFSEFGTVRSVKVKHPKVQSSNPLVPVTTAYSIGYVDFDKEEEAQRAIEKLNGTMFGGN